MMPFLYPSEPHLRRHGPRGYRDHESFRPWLRDEFCFRCVFCLRREQWDRATNLHIDHFLPTSQYPEQQLEYDNLLYACGHCNLAKSSQTTPDPSQSLLSEVVIVLADGVLATTDPQAQRLIAQLRLNSPELVHFRRLWLEIVAMAQRGNPNLYQQLMGFPDDLPDLRTLQPPGGNDRPAGIEQSYLVQRERGQLPAVY
jgi:5-methylcytosine-specific restriction endonuclease McrA